MTDTDDRAPAAPRTKPGISHDTQFFWDGLEAGELRIQQCNTCQRLAHPPVTRCPQCGSYDLGHVAASGEATVYSFVEPLHPRTPAFPDRYVVAVVELAEGTRLITNLVDVDPDAVAIGMPVRLTIREDGGLTLPMFSPVGGAAEEVAE